MTAPFGAAVVGLGVGEQHARAYSADPRVSLRWLVDLDQRKAERLGGELGGRPAELATVLADPETQLISIASYDDAHAAQVVAALGAGKHCFVEKPLCRTPEELAAIAAAWRGSSGLVLRSNLVLRAAPLFVWLRDAIAAGELGEVYAFDGDYLYGRLAKVTEGWRSDVPDYSVMAGGGIHLIDLMIWLTGQRPRDVTSVGARIASRGTAFRYEDYAAATFRFDSGLVGRITANFGAVERHQHVVRVFGTKATVVSDDAGVRMHRSRDSDAIALTLDPLPPSKGVLIPAFVSSVELGDDPWAAQHELDLVSAVAAADLARADGGQRAVRYE
ncbi:MAG: Gfo/Idh/MocA family oxidoreductase [Chloroflexi bacterium]|nr:Gfo/Idh/MocA family oxidoreductase [Chloroflexota bacterium]